MGEVWIHRKHKHEAEQAIKDLVARGYEVVFPLTEKISGGKVFDRDKDNKAIFSHATFGKYWVAKLRR